MKKVIFMFSFLFCLTLSFAHAPAETICNDEVTSVCVDETATVSMDEMFGSGKFYGCYVAAAAFPIVTYDLVPQGPFPTISGVIDCQPDFITLVPFIEYDIMITTNQQIWLFLQWEFCNVGGGVPGQSLVLPGTYNVGSIFITC